MAEAPVIVAEVRRLEVVELLVDSWEALGMRGPRGTAMTRYDRPDEALLLGEVIGSASSYHRPTCHIIQFIEKSNYKRLRNWEEAVGLGLLPCGVCGPYYSPPNKAAEAQPMQRSPVLSPDLTENLDAKHRSKGFKSMQTELSALREETEES